MSKKGFFVLCIVSSLMYHSHAEQESFILPRKKSVPSVSYEQLCELLGDVMHMCTRLQHCLADVCGCAVGTTRAILTRNKRHSLVSVSRQERTERAQRIKRCVIRAQALEKELRQLCYELTA